MFGYVFKNSKNNENVISFNPIILSKQKLNLMFRGSSMEEFGELMVKKYMNAFSNANERTREHGDLLKHLEIYSKEAEINRLKEQNRTLTKQLKKEKTTTRKIKRLGDKFDIL